MKEGLFPRWKEKLLSRWALVPRVAMEHKKAPLAAHFVWEGKSRELTYSLWVTKKWYFVRFSWLAREKAVNQGCGGGSNIDSRIPGVKENRHNAFPLWNKIRLPIKLLNIPGQ